MHNLVTGWGYVDHINGFGLDNRRSNLRASDYATNATNQRIRKNNTSGYKGVARNGRGWRALIQKDGHKTHLGTFATPELAALAYDQAAIELFGEFARPNFPDPTTKRNHVPALTEHRR